MSAVWPLQVAIDAAFQSDPALNAVIAGRVFSLLAPQGTPRPYIVLGDSAEGAFRTFGRAGHDGAETLHLWGADKSVIATLYDHIDRILNGRRLTLDGHTHVRGVARLVTVILDEYAHGVVEYTVLTQRGA